MNDAGRNSHEPRHPDLLRLMDYWRGKRGARDFPRRADIDAVDLGFMLARIAVTEVHEDPRPLPAARDRIVVGAAVRPGVDRDMGR